MTSSRARAVSFHEPNGKKATNDELDEIYERMKKRGVVLGPMQILDRELKKRMLIEQPLTKKELLAQNSVKAIKDVTRGKR